MSDSKTSTSQSSRPGQTSGGISTEWEDVLPLFISSENAMDPTEVNATWVKLFRLARLSSPNESIQKAFKLAVFAYLCKNGTSREGNYEGSFIISDGTKIPAAVIPQAVTKMMIRKFMRGNMTDSYFALKTSGVMKLDEGFVAKANDLGIAPDCAFAMADWMGDCPHFTPSEANAHRKSFNFALRRANGARGGKSLEQVEGDRMDEVVESQHQGGDFAGRKIEF